MSTKIAEKDWAIALKIFRASLPRRGAKGRDDRLFLETMHYLSRHDIKWRALPERFGNWNSVWKRFDRLNKAGVFETFFDRLAALPSTAHLVPMFDGKAVHTQVAPGAEKCGDAGPSAPRSFDESRSETDFDDHPARPT